MSSKVNLRNAKTIYALEGMADIRRIMDHHLGILRIISMKVNRPEQYAELHRVLAGIPVVKG